MKTFDRTRLGLLVLALSLAGCAAGEPVRLRVLSYNIHHGEGVDGELDLERIAGVIRESGADLVALQEVDRGVRRTDGVDQPGRLAALTGMRAVFEKNIAFQGGEYGNAILSRLPVEAYENHRLPSLREGEQRGMLMVRVRVAGRPLVFCATHFDYRGDDAERIASVDFVREFVEGQDDIPVILAGDLNALPESRVIRRLNGFLTDGAHAGEGDGFTFPANEPVRRIDYLMHNRGTGARCVRLRVLDEAVASDHRPVLATFELRIEN